jgi:nucleoid-associated protein YgaU
MVVAYRRMDYDYDYEDGGERYDGRILWGRIAVYGVVFVVIFLLVSWWGGRGSDGEDDRVVELEAQVDALAAENRELQDTIDAMSAGEEEPPADEEEADAAEEPEENADEEPEPEPETQTYVVQPGDTLRGIAEEVYGDPAQWEAIAEANGLTRETVLTVGQELVIPPLDGGDA